MKGKPFLIMVSALLFIISCDKKEQIESLSFEKDMKQIIFFSNEEQYEQEITYYDAIIQLKREFPEEFKNMKVLTASQMEDHYNTFKIDHCPALVVYYNNEVIAEVQGLATTHEIVTPISQALSKTY